MRKWARILMKIAKIKKVNLYKYLVINSKHSRIVYPISHFVYIWRFHPISLVILSSAKKSSITQIAPRWSSTSEDEVLRSLLRPLKCILECGVQAKSAFGVSARPKWSEKGPHGRYVLRADAASINAHQTLCDNVCK
jgi:hypothetical protein